jgi:SAM-dependent methyltransferase
MNHVQNTIQEFNLPHTAREVDFEKNESAVDLRTGYWDNYYSHDPLIRKQPPSQFAAFVASECGEFPMIVDVGCGNGRDTLFFAQLGHSTLGIDKSSSAIDQSAQKIIGKDDKLEKNSFVCMNALFLPSASDLIKRLSSKKKVIYSRFFLHAITEEEQSAFFDFSAACMQTGDILALEFRTTQDLAREKVTASHYRRYIDASHLAHHLTNEFSYSLIYFAEGTGFAKFRSDDAYVARLLLLKD